MKKLKMKFSASVLTKQQMKNIKGGLEHCVDGDYALCNDGCFPKGINDDTPYGICLPYGGWVSPHCYLDSDCFLPDQG